VIRESDLDQLASKKEKELEAKYDQKEDECNKRYDAAIQSVGATLGIFL
jgi:hypothetical protein